MGQELLELGVPTWTVQDVMHALSARYSQRLGVSETELMRFHARMSSAAAQLRAQWLSSQTPHFELEGA